jgi:hypothetical protein
MNKWLFSLEIFEVTPTSPYFLLFEGFERLLCLMCAAVLLHVPFCLVTCHKVGTVVMRKPLENPRHFPGAQKPQGLPALLHTLKNISSSKYLGIPNYYFKGKMHWPLSECRGSWY